MIFIKDNDCFHVHTYRCGHAENISDETYIKKALSIGASGIWFSDHAPFPEDIFRGRMKYSELDEYISTLTNLKKKYSDRISVHIGLEIEYLPSYDNRGYYNYLLNDKKIEYLLLGQHMAEVKNGEYTFQWDKKYLSANEYHALGNAEIQGIRSGYFSVIAHPDRIYRRKKDWDDKCQTIADLIINTAIKNNVLLEQNEESKRHKNHYRNEFWSHVNDKYIIHGLDAHSADELKIICSEV